MKLKIYKALWGMKGSIEDQLKQIAEAGYDGVESRVPKNLGQFKKLLSECHLNYIPMIFTIGPNHAASFDAQLKEAIKFDPPLVVSHSAKDAMTFDEQALFFESALKSEKKYGVPVAHETHRGRAMYAPWITANLLKRFQNLKINADFSHWCCVCESLLDDQKDAVQLACERAIHIHGRVGYEEGPQVPDPRAPEYERYVQKHESWWDAIFKHQKKMGKSFATFTPEFGPPNYMHTLPYTKQPVADLWEICMWMAERTKKRLQSGNFRLNRQFLRSISGD